jgi:diguanylate cyclase (GGDEF)-like protein
MKFTGGFVDMKKIMRHKRNTIGVLVNSIDDFYESAVWKGIENLAEEKDFNLLFFAGANLKSTMRNDANRNVIYDLINIDKIDGLIMFSAILANDIGADQFLNFIERYNKVPMVSIGIDLKEIPSVIFDNRESMHLLVNHLIEVHNYTRIAFLTGPSSNVEAVLRNQGYEDALREHNIPIVKSMVVEGDFEEKSAAKAINILLSSNIVQPQVIVCANDQMAIGVYLYLNKLGIKVGEEIALTGFDDIEVVSTFSPSFTTISQPLFEMATKAAELISEIIIGNKVPQCINLKGKLIIRESCGCSREVENISSLSKEECLLVSTRINKKSILQQYNFKRMYAGTRDIMHQFSFAESTSELADVIKVALDWYQIKQCYVCIYDTPIEHLIDNAFEYPTKVRLIFSYNEGKEGNNYRFDTREMLPNKFLYQDKRNNLIFFPLVASEYHFGYIACTMKAVDEFVFENFREQISNTLKMQMLSKERRNAEEQLNLAVSDLKKANGELKSINVIDELTGIYNRRGFNINGGNLYKFAVITGGKFIFCFGDIDKLKVINDTYGHKEGDEAILNTALLLKKTFGNDDVIARMGGDEFTMIKANKSSTNDINVILESVNHNFNEYNKTSNKPYELSISLGFSVYSPELNYSFDELLQQADSKLYIQKRNKKNLCVNDIIIYR